MRGTADADVSAFDEVDLRLAGLYENVAAAAQNGFHLAMDDIDVHVTLHGDGFSFDGADDVEGRLVGPRGGRHGGKNRGQQSKRNDACKHRRAGATFHRKHGLRQAVEDRRRQRYTTPKHCNCGDAAGRDCAAAEHLYYTR